MGLIGLAFHPNFAQNRVFYLNYITYAQYTVISRFTWTEGDMDATKASEALIFTWIQPEQNHKGSWMAFPPSDIANPMKAFHDLYISTGDGGGAYDQHGEFGNAQVTSNPYGKMLRVRIPEELVLAPADPAQIQKLYTIPPDNPFAYGTGSTDRRPCPRSTLTGCATPGAAHSTARRTRSGAATWGRTRWRRSRSWRRGGTTVGACTRVRAARRDPGQHLRPGLREARLPVLPHSVPDDPPARGEEATSKAICKDQPLVGQSITGGCVHYTTESQRVAVQ